MLQLSIAEPGCFPDRKEVFRISLLVVKSPEYLIESGGEKRKSDPKFSAGNPQCA